MAFHQFSLEFPPQTYWRYSPQFIRQLNYKLEYDGLVEVEVEVFFHVHRCHFHIKWIDAPWVRTTSTVVELLELRTNGTDDPTFPPRIHHEWKNGVPYIAICHLTLWKPILVEKYAACGSQWKTGGKLVELNSTNLNSTNPKCLLEITSITLENIQIHKHTFIMI